MIEGRGSLICERLNLQQAMIISGRYAVTIIVVDKKLYILKHWATK